jgi:hypothetical protein
LRTRWCYARAQLRSRPEARVERDKERAEPEEDGRDERGRELRKGALARRALDGRREEAEEDADEREEAEGVRRHGCDVRSARLSRRGGGWGEWKEERKVR